MKMMSRTRTTSTSGVTLMSELRPPPPPVAIPMMESFSCFAPALLRADALRLLLGDQADRLESRALDRHHGLLHVPVGEPRVGLDDDGAVLVPLVGLFDLRVEIRLGHPVLVDPHLFLVGHADEDLV